MRSVVVGLGLLLLALVYPLPAVAQPAPGGTLRVTVVDATGAVIVGATVTVSGIETATMATAHAPIQTANDGIATVTRLVPGRYGVEAEFPGFETRRIADVRVRNGDNRQVLLLPIAGLKDAVDVAPNRQEAAADPHGASFGTTLTREQLEALSDDPDVLRQQLQDMAGPGALIKVDSFEGGALPPKSQIKSIRISRDQFAAENHSAGGTQIEIITQPGIGPIRFNAGGGMRGGSLSGRSPFTPTLGPEQNRNYSFGGGGTLIKNKSSFNLFVNARNSYDTPAINIASTAGKRSEALALKTPRDFLNVYGQVDYAVTLDQMLRFTFTLADMNNRNLGIGAYDEETRAYSTKSGFNTIRAQQFGPLGRRAYLRTRIQYSWSDTSSHSAAEAPTIIVNDAFTSGGAQIAGGQHSRIVNLGSDLDYVRGIHTFRTGVAFDAGRSHSNDTSNYLGTYTFESLDAFQAGRPRSYSRRVGDPNLRYATLQGAGYIQDDLRVRRNLTLSAGVRYEAQAHVQDFNNIAPRMGVTWAPFAGGQTTLRSSWGIFYDWLSTNTYDQTQRVDGVHQREVNISNPSYPDVPDLTASALPANRYLLGSNLQLPASNRLSVGIDQRLAKLLQSSATYSYTRGTALARGLNLNAPVNGVRLDPAFGNVVEVVSDARSRLHQLQINLTANPGALLPSFNAPRIKWSRTTVFINYTLASIENNTDGPFSLPPSGTLDTEWGPATNDVRHRFNGTLNNQIVRNLSLSFNMSVTGGQPYTIRTGSDDNGDLVFNDRPTSVGRNSERAATQWTINTFVGYSFAFGKTPSNLPPGITVITGGGVPTVQSFNQGPRYRLQFFVQSQNLTNRANYIGYSGTKTSPFFGQPTAVSATRKVDAGFTLSF